MKRAAALVTNTTEVGVNVTTEVGVVKVDWLNYVSPANHKYSTQLIVELNRQWKSEVEYSDVNKDITPKAKDTNLKAKATTPKAKDSTPKAKDFTLKAKIKDVTVEGKKFRNNWQSNSTFY